MSRNAWLSSGLISVASGLVVAVPMTVADWRLNPAGLFRDAEATHWGIVFETAFSWFLPVALIALAISLAVAKAWSSSRRNR